MAGNFATWLNTATLPEFSDLTKKQFEHVKEMVTPKAMPLFIHEDLTSWPHQQKRYDEMDIETFAKAKREGEDAQKAKLGVGYNKTMEARRYAREITVSYEFRRYAGAYSEHVKSDMKSLTHFIPQRKDLDLTHRLTFCNATSYTDMDGVTVATTVGDGLALISASHTLAHSSSTYSNSVTGNPAFSQGALEIARNTMRTNTLSNFGEKRVITPNTIITTEDEVTVNDVARLLRSTADPDAAHAGVYSPQRARYSHVALPYLDTDAQGDFDSTKQRWWFLAATGMGFSGWQAVYGTFEEANLKDNPYEDFHNDDWTFGVRGSWGIAILSGRGIVGSLPTS